MAEKADDLGIPMKLRPAGTTMPPARCRSAPPRRCASARPRITAHNTNRGISRFTGNEVDRRTLIIGEGISLAGEVTSCDRLIVEVRSKQIGEPEYDCRETGAFQRPCVNENADVRGRFEADWWSENGC